MTDQDRRDSLREELERAHGALAASDLLLSHGMLPDALNRAYYAVLHAARALLLSVGVETQSHTGLRSELGRHFFKPGLLPAEAAKTLRSLQADREEADYGRFLVIDPAQAERSVQDAKVFLELVETFLRAGGWLI